VSLVARLLEWLVAPLLFLWFAAGIVTFASLHSVLDEAADRRLLETSSHVQTLWRSAGQSAPQVQPLLASLASGGARGYLIAIFDRNGAELVSTVPGQIELAPGALHGKMVTLTAGDENARCGVTQRDALGPTGATAVVCDASSDRTNQSLAVFRHILIPQALILAIALILVWYGLRYLLRPLTQLRGDLDRRGMGDLGTIEMREAPRELGPLLVSVNNLMTRLRAGFDSQSRFVANAAHQLRTPLAAMHTHIELAHRLLKNGDVKQAEAIIGAQTTLSNRTTRLANQLLALAGSEAILPDRLGGRVAIAQAMSNVLARCAVRAAASQVALNYEEIGAASKWNERGDATLIEEAISNVIENAISFAPADTEVRCVADALAREVRVYDSGPGVAASEAEGLFAPFVRGAEAAHAGSGLGLSIVQEIMRRHGGDARFATCEIGSGACLVLSFSMQKT
jgi:two-component system, OmpR family, sensor histidine kinase TctE